MHRLKYTLFCDLLLADSIKILPVYHGSPALCISVPQAGRIYSARYVSGETAYVGRMSLGPENIQEWTTSTADNISSAEALSDNLLL
jgi:hypothetical protein